MSPMRAQSRYWFTLSHRVDGGENMGVRLRGTGFEGDEWKGECFWALGKKVKGNGCNGGKKLSLISTWITYLE